jgi:hypothetical protein
MPNPSLSSFTNSSQYQTESVLNPLITGFVAGSTYAEPSFTGDNNAVINNIGGLFGWLIYSRATKYSPALGTTADTYIAYTSANAVVSDLNQLGGVTYCLVSTTTQGGTFGFFRNTSGVLSALTAGTDFLYAINYLAYGGTLVIAGTTAGLNKYETNNSTSIDVLLGSTANGSLCSWLLNKPYITGIFPAGADSTGQLGAGYTMPAYDAFVTNPSGTLAAGSTFSTRLFTVCGVKTSAELSTDSVVPSSKMTYVLPAISDVAGAFTRAKERNELYLSVAGLNRSTALNGTITNSVDWSDVTTKNILRKNRVNFFVNYKPQFLGQDLVGGTAGASTTIIVDERVGPARLKVSITNDVTTIALKYLYLVNNTANRSNLTSEVSTYLERYAQYLDTTKTQIICDSTNNQDNSQALNISVTVKPILSTESFTILVNLLS